MKSLRIALIPSYEPDELLPRMIPGVKDGGFEIVVVDDGSGEKYRNIFESLPEYVHIISYPENHGKGYALKTGLEYIKEKYGSDYIVVTMDSDGQHRVEDAVKLCDAAEAEPGTLILGSRKQGRKTPLRSRMGNAITRTVFDLATKSGIYDTQTGLRAFDSSLTEYMLAMNGNRYEYEMNVLLYLGVSGIACREITVETIYFDNNSGSHFDTVKDAFKVYREIFGYSRWALAALGIDLIAFIAMTLLNVNILIANIAAKVAGTAFCVAFNYKSKFGGRKKTYLVRYILLALAIIAGNTTFIFSVCNFGGMNVYASKIIAEVGFFIISWLLQKLFFAFDKRLWKQND